MTFDAFLAHKTEEIQGKLIEKRQIFWWFHLVALQNASLWMSVLTSLFRLSYENIEWSMFQKWWIKDMFSFLHPVPITCLIGWRKHSVTSQTTPRWSLCALMSVVTTTDSSKIRIPLQKPHGKCEQAPSAWWRRGWPLYDFILLCLWVV